MRNKFSLLILLALIVFPAISSAAVFKFEGEKVNIKKDEVINDDLYVGGGEVIIDGTVNGDLIVFGGQVNVSGKVSEGLFVAGGQVVVDGEVGKNIRVAGGNVYIRGKVGHDLLVASGNVDIDKTAEIKNDVKVGAGQLSIAGKTGSIEAGVGNLNIRGTAEITGDVKYTSENEAFLDNSAKISGKVTRIAPPVKNKKDMAGFIAVAKIISMLSMILVSLLIIWIFPKKSENIAESFQAKFPVNLLWGFLFLIAIPVITILLFMTVIGLPIAFGAVMFYVAMLYLGKIFGIISFGTWVQNLGKKDKNLKPNIIFVVLAVIFYSLLKLIPFIGWIGTSLIFLAGLGALIRFDWNFLSQLKKDKKI